MAKKYNVTGNCFPNQHYMADVSHKMADTLKWANEWITVQGKRIFMIWV